MVDGLGPRIMLYPNPIAGTGALILHINRGAKKLCIHHCVESLPGGGMSRLPLPHEVIGGLREQARSTGRSVVVGLDAYLSLLDSDNIKATMAILYALIDEDDLNVTFLLSSTWAQFLSVYFKNPKYENSMQLISVAGELSGWNMPQITVVPIKWMGIGLRGYAELLSSLVEFEPVTGCLVVGVSDYSVIQAGLNAAITQIVEIGRYMRTFYAIDDLLPEPVFEYIFTKIREYNLSPIEAMQRDFGYDNCNSRLAPKHLADCTDATKWAACVWMLRKIIDNNTYLHRVLDTNNLSRDNFRRTFVVTSAVSSLKHGRFASFVEERRTALREMADDATALISEFIDATTETPDDTIAPWLNNDTEAEHIEILRRVGKVGLGDGLPKYFEDVYLLLSDYLSCAFDFGNPTINRYFNSYRSLKVQNTVTRDFAKTAYDMVVPRDIPSRNSMLQQLAVNSDTCLLVVDGMGAEYLPLILALAKRRGINVESCDVAKAELPSSTEYNPITWDAARMITGDSGEKEVKAVDNIAHLGASKGEGAPFERNFAAALDVFAHVVFKRISNGLSKFARVVVTSDHGSSRLAVLAHNNGLSETLKAYGEVLDWRYTTAVKDQERPPELEATLSGFWVVRGYNRLPKQGGKLNELHGGATLEEQLVPVVVFTRETATTSPTKMAKKSGKQIVERMDFDDI
ncbi:MAG: BREX-4 system phosphatase PglZ [Peptococcaceae bacterium]|nr:BREX-4 system phosphatase PglZ [Peptococcaceae bacterium]